MWQRTCARREAHKAFVVHVPGELAYIFVKVAALFISLSHFGIFFFSFGTHPGQIVRRVESLRILQLFWIYCRTNRWYFFFAFLRRKRTTSRSGLLTQKRFENGALIRRPLSLSLFLSVLHTNGVAILFLGTRLTNARGAYNYYDRKKDFHVRTSVS